VAALGGRSLQPGGVLKGRVTTPDGVPIRNVLVTAQMPALHRGRSVVGSVNAQLHTLTDERGEFKLEDLSAGEYYIVAMPPSGRTASGSGRNGFAITWHPPATAVSDAKPVALAFGATVTADIRMVSAPLARLSGTVYKSDGTVAPGAALGLTHGSGLFGIGSQRVPVDATGSFSMPGVPPGTYFLLFPEAYRDDPPKVSGVRVDVHGEDISGIRVRPIHMATVRGRVVIDPVVRASLGTPLTVSGFPFSSDGNPGPQRAGTVKEDSTFEFRTWPAHGFVRVFAGGRELFDFAVRLNGKDVTQDGVDFVEDAVISGVEIAIHSRR
jgi:hypothetical protein